MADSKTSNVMMILRIMVISGAVSAYIIVQLQIKSKHIFDFVRKNQLWSILVCGNIYEK